MQKRIRYLLNPETNVRRSIKPIATAAGEVYVEYNKTNRTACITTVGGKQLDGFVYTVSEHQLKIDLKKKLVALGAKFDKEKRVQD